MAPKFDENKMTEVLNWCYEKAINGLPGSPSAKELAEQYLRESSNADEAIDSLIRWQVPKCSASGFINGLGGLLTLPVAIPADLAATTYIHIRMVAAIAHMRGLPLHSDATKTAVYLCLIGDSVGDVLNRLGLEFDGRLAKVQLATISGVILIKINRAVSLRLLTKTGGKGVFALAKAAPILGGVVGGTVNAVSCRAIGKTAKIILTS